MYVCGCLFVQGQEPVAEDAMDQAAEFGHWVIVQNIHLIHAWLPILEKKLEINCENSHENYRLFMSAEPPADKTVHIIPQGKKHNALFLFYYYILQKPLRPLI